MNTNNLIKFVINFSFIFFVNISLVNSASYEFIKQKIIELREGDLQKRIETVQILGSLSSNANFAIAEMINILKNDENHELRMQEP